MRACLRVRESVEFITQPIAQVLLRAPGSRGARTLEGFTHTRSRVCAGCVHVVSPEHARARVIPNPIIVCVRAFYPGFRCHRGV